MKFQINASKIYILLIVFSFFGCKEQLFDSPYQENPADPASAVTTPGTTTNEENIGKWYNDTTAVILPVSDGKKLNTAYKRGNTNATIVILGSSTAAGNGASKSTKGWVELMKAKLKKDNKTVSVINLGVPGADIYNIMPTGTKVANRPAPDSKKNINKALSYKPFLVIVNMPTNDVERNYTDDEIIKNYVILQNKLVSEKVAYLFTGTQPRNFSVVAKRNRLPVLNQKLVNADPTHAIDVFKKLSAENFTIKKYFAHSDGKHPNDKGHAVINGYLFNNSVFQQMMGYKSVNP